MHFSLTPPPSQECVTFMDGGPSLINITQKLLPKVNIQRCARHILDDMAKNRESQDDREQYMRMVMLSTGFKREAEAIYNKIKPNSVIK